MFSGDEAIVVFDECLLTGLATEGEFLCVLRCSGCDVGGVEEHAAHEINCAAGTTPDAPSDLDKTYRVGNSFEASRRQGREVGFWVMPNCVAEVSGQELASGAGRCYTYGEIDCAADIIAFTVEDRAAMRADVQGRAVRLGVGEAIHRQAEGDGVGGLGEQQASSRPRS